MGRVCDDGIPGLGQPKWVDLEEGGNSHVPLPLAVLNLAR